MDVLAYVHPSPLAIVRAWPPLVTQLRNHIKNKAGGYTAVKRGCVFPSNFMRSFAQRYLQRVGLVVMGGWDGLVFSGVLCYKIFRLSALPCDRDRM